MVEVSEGACLVEAVIPAKGTCPLLVYSRLKGGCLSYEGICLFVLLLVTNAHPDWTRRDVGVMIEGKVCGCT